MQAKLKTAYRDNYLQVGIPQSDRLCRFVRPLSMGLIEQSKTAEVAAELARRCKERNYTIGTGFLTAGQLLSVLSDNGHLDTAYRLLENTEAPGWLYEVEKGATTTWENWLGVDESGVPVDSHNHYAPGSVVAWLFSYCAGIRPLKPGYEAVEIRPMPGGSLTWAKAKVSTCRGTIASEWSIDLEFHLHVEAPEGVSTTVILPNGEVDSFNGGRRDYNIILLQ